jgi:tetratricopeptide (TPR) repeat protein
MTFPPSWRYRNSCRKTPKMVSRTILLIAGLGLLASCSSLSENLYPSSEPKESDSATREKKRQKVVSSQFEWAVQNYEAGEYQLAITQFRKLKSMGPSVPGFELVPFYLGMSLYQTQQFPEATAELENFLKSESNVSESQDARVALLSIYEKTRQWDRLLGLAAETDKLTLFQDKRAFLKLVWAQALQAKGEYKGAKAVLKDAAQYLDGHSAKRSNGPDLDKDLWGRYHYTNFLLSTEDCRRSPKEVGSGKGKKRLYQPWLESTVDCYRYSLDQIARELGESGWSPLAFAELERSIGSFGENIQNFMKLEKARLENRRALEGLARQNLYRLLSKTEDTIKIFKNQGLDPTPLDSIRKRIDLLLVSLARPS